ncbi:MAG: histidine triad nucleotide-binding protein [Clostridiales bacterium]|nr:histidine triad nucleotide-binding protein [Clostridiales bacterium]
MDNCIFCKIVAGDIPSNKVYEDDKILCFRDIAPMAPVHLLVIPKEHIPSADHITNDNADIVAHIFATIPLIAKAEGISESGYRIITNHGDDARQSVKHLHFHVLAGKQLPENMG